MQSGLRTARAAALRRAGAGRNPPHRAAGPGARPCLPGRAAGGPARRHRGDGAGRRARSGPGRAGRGRAGLRPVGRHARPAGTAGRVFHAQQPGRGWLDRQGRPAAARAAQRPDHERLPVQEPRRGLETGVGDLQHAGGRIAALRRAARVVRRRRPEDPHARPHPGGPRGHLPGSGHAVLVLPGAGRAASRDPDEGRPRLGGGVAASGLLRRSADR